MYIQYKSNHASTKKKGTCKQVGAIDLAYRKVTLTAEYMMLGQVQWPLPKSKARHGSTAMKPPQEVRSSNASP